ncbi:hypothetical protein [Streptomyces werraensis]|uniref:hypothetical protein n=1 Tax=Streptomyces werraensis TaxID=68284 RepID=UPI003820AD50
MITPQTILVGQGKVFISSSFIAACESLGMCVQPAPPGNGPAEEHVERTFSSINTLFVQHVAACTGSHTGERGKDAEGEAVRTPARLDRHPMTPRCALSPKDGGGADRRVRVRPGATGP